MLSHRLIRELLPLAMITAVTLIGLNKVDQLPEKIAIHFDMNGLPDNWMSSKYAMLILPALYLCTYLLMSVCTYYIPNMYVWKVLIIFILCNVHLATIYYAMGKFNSIYWPMLPSVILLAAYLAYLFLIQRH